MTSKSVLLALVASFLGATLVVHAANETSAENALTDAEKAAGWKLLFDGKTLNGWKISENPDSFAVRDGMIIAQGRGVIIKDQAPHPKSHLFYVGPQGDASFKDFEFQADVKTEHLANSGVYFHTEFIADSWPQKGFEIQIDNDPTHAKKTGSLYAVSDITKSPAQDGKWVHLHLSVIGKRVVIKLDDQTVVDWTEPAGFIVRHPPWFTERKLSSGTFALQGHDSESTVYFKNIKVKPLVPATSQD